MICLLLFVAGLPFANITEQHKMQRDVGMEKPVCLPEALSMGFTICI